MPSTARPKPRPSHVTIVANSPETLDGLAAYLAEAGVMVRGTRRIDLCLEMVPPASSAVVLFPDDFPSSAMAEALGALRRHRPATLVVLVTGDPRRFERPARDGHAVSLVLAKPAWGWTLLDAIRARLDGSSESETKR